MRRTLAVLALAALGAVALAGGLVTSEVAAGDGPAATIEGPNGEHQVVVCKYVGIPGVGERLQTGSNPIVVDSHALEGRGFNGAFPFDFSDQHGNSKAIRWASGPHDGSISECPGQPPASEVTAVAPLFRDPTCDVAAVVKLPTVEGVEYAVDGTVAPGRTVTVEATAAEGYVLAGTREWMHTFGLVPENCTPPPEPIEVVAGVTFRDPTCEVGAAVVPTTTTGVTYRIEGNVAPGETVRVTAAAAEGYAITGPSTWEHTFGQAPGNCTAPTTPMTPPTEPATTPADDVTSTTPAPTTTAPKPTAPFTPPTTPTQAPEARKRTATPATSQQVAGAETEQRPTLAYTP